MYLNKIIFFLKSIFIVFYDKKKLKYLFLINFLVIFTQLSCNKNPNWNKFFPKNLKELKSESSLNSGFQTIFWEFTKEERPTDSVIIEFAQKQGWKFIRKEKLASFMISKWGNQFPLGPFGLQSLEEFSFTSSNKFPINLSDSNFSILHFKTNKALIDFRDQSFSFHNGFIILNETQMQSFYLWGE